MVDRPSGTITFLMTDIEGSTARWEQGAEAMRTALATHDETLRESIAAAGGFMFKHTGDGIVAAFASPRAAVEAAIAAQRQLELPVRMGICTGEAERRDDDYFGPPVNRAARIMAAGHGGQILLAGSTAALLDGFDLLDLGEHRLRGLVQRQRLFQVKAAGLRGDFAPLSTLESSSGNLPTPATALLGRENDLSSIAALLGEVRLVTLTGVGGVGKTRLMLEAAALAAGAYPDGAWLIELAGVGELDAAEHVIAAVLGVKQLAGSSMAQSVADALGGRRLLLVLDNCEHLIEPVSMLVRQILARCPRVSVLATSREALSVEGERVQLVSPLAFSAGIDSPAVALFVERARAVSPGFDLVRDADAVMQICRRLDGIPLAIELAAARVRAMSPRQIHDRLDERFRLLAGGRRALGRHQTLAQAVQWSYDLLSEAERTVLARASVFAGGFNLEAAESVCTGGEVATADVLDLVDSLLRKSLLTVEDSGDVVRYGMLETIRQFAAEQGSGELELARRRHANYFASESDRRFIQWRSPRQLEAYRWLELEMDNLRVAFRWALDRGEVDPAAQIASNVGDLARFILRDEAANWASEIVDAARQACHRRLTVLLTWAASSAWATLHFEDAKRFGTEAIGLVDDPSFDPFVLAYTDLAMIALYEGDPSTSVDLVRMGAAHSADATDRFCCASMPFWLATAGRHEEAMHRADEALAQAIATGVPSSVAVAYWSKGAAFAKSNPEAAIAAYEAGLAVALRSGNYFWAGVIAADFAALQARSSASEKALVSFRGLIAMWRGSRDAMLIARGTSALVLLFDRLGRVEAAATLYGSLPKLLERSAHITELGQVMMRVRATLGDAAFDTGLRRGAAMAINEAFLFAQAQIDEALMELR